MNRLAYTERVKRRSATWIRHATEPTVERQQERAAKKSRQWTWAVWRFGDVPILGAVCYQRLDYWCAWCDAYHLVETEDGE